MYTYPYLHYIAYIYSQQCKKQTAPKWLQKSSEKLINTSSTKDSHHQQHTYTYNQQYQPHTASNIVAKIQK